MIKSCQFFFGKKILIIGILFILFSCSRNKSNTVYDIENSNQFIKKEKSENNANIVQNFEIEQDSSKNIDIVSEEEYLASYADTDCSLTKPKMIFVEGNEHLDLSSFEIGETEVTIEQYCTVIGETEFNKEWGKHPIAGINWFEAIMFCNKLSIMNGYEPCYTLNGEKDPSLWKGDLPYYTEADGHVGDISEWNPVRCNFNANGYRLPTKKEWAFAARGGNKSNHTQFSGSDDIDEVGWTEENSKERQQVATKKPNELCIYDMSGNVWEWCWDKMRSDPNDFRRIVKGGGCGTPASYSAISYISSDEPDVQSLYYGFRLCRSIGER